MKDRSDRHARAIARSLIAASSAAVLMLSQASCDGLGLGKKGDADESASTGLEEPKMSRGSLFNRAKNRNAWIDESVQTTRRDHYSAQNSTTFAPVEESPTGRSNELIDARPRSNDDFALEPDPASDPDPSPMLDPGVGARSGGQDEPLQLPTLDSDFPQAGQAPRVPEPFPEPIPRPVPERQTEDDGYIPLQPKLPGDEPIEPPTD